MSSDTADIPSPPPLFRTLEEPVRLSRSRLWELERAYFERQGIAAWRQGIVPHFITSNAFTARAYARAVLGFLRDVGPGLAAGQPVYLVELGAGSGRFGYHFLLAFSELLAGSSLGGLSFCYVLTDFHAASLAFWREHPQLAPWVERGVLDWGLFDAEHGESLALENRGVTLAAGGLANPLVVFANYLFDGLPLDLFRLGKGTIEECRLGLGLALGPGEELPEGEPFPSLDLLGFQYAQALIEGPYYDDPTLEDLLGLYRRSLDGGYLSLPVAAIDAVRRLARLAGAGLFLLSADRGYARPEALLHRGLPELAQHGSVSFPVNYHAIAQEVRRQGGIALLAERGESLSVNAFVLNLPGRALPETRLACREDLHGFGPDAYFEVQQRLEQDLLAMPWVEVLAFLQLSAWDAKVFAQCVPRLADLLREGLDATQEAELCEAVERVWAGYFFLGEVYDLAFDLGTVLQQVGSHRRALELFAISLERHGAHGAVFFNQALSHYGMWRRVEAIDCLHRALEVDPANEGARVLLRRIEGALRRGGEGAGAGGSTPDPAY
jgi:tetratricopeptide (TPR) repeat protein